MEIEWEDVPAYEITVKVVVTGDTYERAQEFLDGCFMVIKRVEECELFDWDFVDWEEA